MLLLCRTLWSNFKKRNLICLSPLQITMLAPIYQRMAYRTPKPLSKHSGFYYTKYNSAKVINVNCCKVNLRSETASMLRKFT